MQDPVYWPWPLFAYEELPVGFIMWQAQAVVAKTSSTAKIQQKSISLHRSFALWVMQRRCDLSAAALVRCECLRGQRGTVGKSICIHLSLLTAVDFANYFSARLKAFVILLFGEKSPVSSVRNTGRMTNDLGRQRLNGRPGKADWDGWQSHTEQRMEARILC